MSLALARALPMAADANTNQPVFPENTTIADTKFSIPVSTNQFSAVTLVINPTNAAGAAEIQARPTGSEEWYLYESIDISSGATKFKRIEMPIGQLRVKNAGNSGITVFVEGLPIR